MPTTRNLTILLTDIKGFTDKTSHQTRAAIDSMLEEHRRIVLPILQERGGNLVKTIGDAFLMTFESPTDAVLAGVAVQDALRKRNEGRAPEDRIEVRIAINVGEVNLVEGDIFGEPVNITARVEGVAEAGEVFFTEAVYLAMNKTEVPSSEVGTYKLKGIAEHFKVYKVRRETPVGSGDVPPKRQPEARSAEPSAKAHRVDSGSASAITPVPGEAPTLKRRAAATLLDVVMCGILAGVLAGGDSETYNVHVDASDVASAAQSAMGTAGAGFHAEEGDEEVSLGKDGIVAKSGDESVRMGKDGIDVKDKDVEVKIGPTGITVREKGKPEVIIQGGGGSPTVSKRVERKSAKDKLFPLVWLLMNAGCLAAWGWTPGKKILGLKVVSFAEGVPLDGKTALLRSVMTLVSGYAAGLGYLWSAFEKDKRGWHDLVAGAKVVRA